MEPSEILIDSEFRNLIPQLTSEELSQLRENLIDHGCRDPLVIWHERPNCPCGGIVGRQGSGGLYGCDGCGKAFAVEPVLLDGHKATEH